MSFFSQEELADIRSDPGFTLTLYADRKDEFLRLLNPVLSTQPEEYIKASFASIISYELTPYGNGPNYTPDNIFTLLNRETMMCTNYVTLTWLLYEKMSPSKDVDVAHIGWNNSVLSNHDQMLLSLPGERPLLLDPTIALIALTDGYNAITAGVPIPPSHQKSFFWREELTLPQFNEAVQQALSEGLLHGGYMGYWFSVPQYVSRYGSMIWFPSPQRERIFLGDGSNDLSLVPTREFGEQVTGTNTPWLFGTAGSDRLRAGDVASVIFGGTSTWDGIDSEAYGIGLRAGDFFSAATLAQIRADPATLTTLYTQGKAGFLSALGPAFATLPDEEIRLAFAAVAAHELATFNAQALNADGYALLAWRLFQILVPDTNPSAPAGNPDVSQIGWNGGLAGRTAQLLMSVPDAPSLLVDPTIGHLAIVPDFNRLVAGEAVPAALQASFLTDPTLTDARNGVITALHDGLLRTGNLLYWFSVPDDVEFFLESPHSPGGNYYNWVLGQGPQSFATPQGDVVRLGEAEPSVLGPIASFDRIFAGYGADMLVGNGIVSNEGVWTAALSGRQGWLTGDFDGDGRADIFRIVPGASGADMFLSNGMSFAHDGSWTGLGVGAHGWYVGDFNGDGKADIFRYMPGVSGADMLLSTGSGFVRGGSWTGYGSGSNRWYVGDFNGDGMADIFRYVPGVSGADMMLSTGAGFVRDGSWTGFGSGTDGWYVGDFNGDGKADIFRYMPGVSGADMLLSTGSGFVRDGSWTDYGHGDMRWSVQDVNGDGMDDLVGNPLGAPAASVVLLSTGAGFALTDAWSPEGVGMPRFAVGDFNGDGLPDYLYETAAGAVVLAGNGIVPPETDQFVFTPGTVEGTTIAGFESGVDQLWFEGFGPGARLMHAAGMPADYWTLAYGGGSETFRVIGVTNLGADGYLIA